MSSFHVTADEISAEVRAALIWLGNYSDSQRLAVAECLDTIASNGGEQAEDEFLVVCAREISDAALEFARVIMDNKSVELTAPQVSFFDVEIRNEICGGVSPSTLQSAIESLSQMPDDVVIEACGSPELVNDAESIDAFTRGLQALRLRFGEDMELEDLLERSSSATQ